MFSHLEYFEEPNSDRISKLTMTSKNCEKYLKYHRPIQLFSIFLPLEKYYCRTTGGEGITNDAIENFINKIWTKGLFLMSIAYC